MRSADDVALVLLAGVLAAAIGGELNLELPEGILDVHAHTEPCPMRSHQVAFPTFVAVQEAVHRTRG